MQYKLTIKNGQRTICIKLKNLDMIEITNAKLCTYL